MDEVECPYCGKETEVCHDDGACFEEDVLHETSCDHCDKTFVLTRMVIRTLILLLNSLDVSQS